MENQIVTYLFLVLYAVVFLVNIIGNALVCIVVARSKSLQTFTSLLLVNLATGDLVLGISGTIHLTVSVLTGNNVYMLCSVMSTVVYVSAIVSVYTIAVLAVDRYIAIVKPLYNRSTVTTGKLKVIIPTIWILATALASPSLFFFTGFGYDVKKIACWDTLTQDDFPSVYKIILFVFMFLLPMTVISISYGSIFRYPNLFLYISYVY
jgi:hypothetical protein